MVLLFNGATFKFPIKKLLKESTNPKLCQYLNRILEEKFEFTPEEEVEFAQLCCQSKNFSKISIKSISCPLLFAEDEN
jgi:hypothetical protein